MNTYVQAYLKTTGFINGSMFHIGILMLTALMVLSCQNEEVVPITDNQLQSTTLYESNEPDRVLRSKASGNNHGAQPYNQPLAFPFFNPCTNELVDWSAVIRGVIHSHEDAQGKLHNQYILMLSNAKGVGTSGMNYVATGMFDFVIHSNENDDGSTITNQIHQRFISKGSAPDAVLTFFLHTTINANGVITSHKVEPVEIACK